MLTARDVQLLRSRDVGDTRNRLRAAMHLGRVTQQQLAGAVGLTQPYVSRLVRGQYSELPLETARALAFFFGCEIEDLFPPTTRMERAAR